MGRTWVMWTNPDGTHMGLRCIILYGPLWDTNLATTCNHGYYIGPYGLCGLTQMGLTDVACIIIWGTHSYATVWVLCGAHWLCGFPRWNPPAGLGCRILMAPKGGGGGYHIASISNCIGTMWGPIVIMWPNPDMGHMGLWQRK